ncbi:hypothetical protein Tco_1341546, partial [Tanacetum coccineum]
VIKKSHPEKGQGGMCSREACVLDSHKGGSRLQTQEIDQSRGVAQGCRGSTCAGTGRQCDHTSNGPFGLVVPSRHRASSIGCLVGPSITPARSANLPH